MKEQVIQPNIKLAGFIGVLFAFDLSFPLNAQVAPDGNMTIVVSGTGGRIRVEIAPVNLSRTSLNRYSDFNVPWAGLNSTISPALLDFFSGPSWR